jgi:hypothetical protein
MTADVPSQVKQENPAKEIDCFSCRHFYITYDPSFPYGCRVPGFKSRLLPAKEMLATSGIECQLFLEKLKKP